DPENSTTVTADYNDALGSGGPGNGSGCSASIGLFANSFALCPIGGGRQGGRYREWDPTRFRFHFPSPAANNCQPPFICKAPIPAPTVQRPPNNGPKPLSFWEKAGYVLACFYGLDPEYAKPLGESPQPADSTDSTNTTEGQGTPLGPNKGGRSVPYGG